MKRIAAVTFDLWDTLIQELPGGSGRVADDRIARIAKVLESCGRPHRPDDIREAYVKTGNFLDLAWSKARDMSVRDQLLFMLSCIEWRLPSKLDAGAFDEIEDIYSKEMHDNRPILLPRARVTLHAI